MPDPGSQPSYSLTDALKSRRPAAMAALQQALSTDTIVLDGAEKLPATGSDEAFEGTARLLHVSCTVQTLLSGSGAATLLLICAQPDPSAAVVPAQGATSAGGNPSEASGNPSFGTCFPLMPGAWPAADAGSFFLSNLALDHPIWVYVDAGGADQAQVMAALQTLPLWTQWLSQQQALAPKRNQKDLDFKGDSGLTMWGNLPSPPGFLKKATDFLGIEAGRYLLKATLDYPPLALVSAGGPGAIQTAPEASVSPGPGQDQPAAEDEGTEQAPSFPYLKVQLPLEAGIPFGDDGNTLGSAYLELRSPLFFSTEPSTIGLRGTLELKQPGDPKTIEVEVDFPIGGDVITATGKFTDQQMPYGIETKPPGLPDLQPKDAGGNARAFELDLWLAFSMSQRKLTTAAFMVELEHWPIIDNILTLEKLRFAFVIDDPLGTKLWQVSIDAQAQFGKPADDIDLLCGGSYPGGQLYLRLDTSTRPTLQRILDALDIQVSKEDVPTLAITDLGIDYNFQTKLFSAGIDVAGPWKVHWFTLEDFRFRAIGQAGTSYDLQVAAAFDLGDVQVQLAAMYGSTGWQFLGRAGNIHIKSLIDGLGQAFGSSIDLPAPLEDLVIDELRISFSKSTQTEFQFECEAKYPADGGEADILLRITMQSDSGKPAKGGTAAAAGGVGGQIPTPSWATTSYRYEFSGHVVIAGMTFDLDFVRAGTGATARDLLVATFSEKQPITLADLIREIAGGDVDLAPPISLGLKDAFFVYSKDGQGKKYLLGLTVDADIDLANLPSIVSESLGPDAHAGVQDLTVLYASRALTLDEANAIDQKLTQQSIPQLPAPPSANGGSSQPEAQGKAGQSAPSGVGQGLSVFGRLDLPGGNQLQLMAPRPKRPAALPAPGQTQAPAQPGVPGQTQAPAGSAGQPAKAASPAVASATWFDVQAKLGPITFERVGVRFADQRLWFLLAAALEAGGVTISLQGLGLGFNLKDPADIAFMLAGLGISYQGGPIGITGVFLERQATVYGPNNQPLWKDGKPETVTQYAGEVRIAAETFSILGVGAYGKLIDGDPTLFIYGALSAAEGEGIGYPPILITGLALGFGINYRVVIPPIEQVSTFPLVEMVMGSGAAASGQASLTPPAQAEPGQVLSKLLGGPSPALEIQPGQYFGALGLRFNLFECIDCFALAVAQGGNDLEISLLGLGRLKEPQEGNAICYIELALLIDIRPAQGVLRVEAQLTANSWVFDQSCRLTGGFALVVWYGGQHRGDFVLSIGGYHPRFARPDYYPTVPRVGYNMRVGPLDIKGESYFALTTSAIMAGGSLEATFNSGPISAYLKAYVDFLVQWKPLHYDIAAGIEVRVDADLALFSVHLSVSVDLSLVGPPFHGRARVHAGALSFTIKFGNWSEDPGLIKEWAKFGRSFVDRSDGDAAKQWVLAAAQAPAATRGPQEPQPQTAAGPTIHQLNLVAGQISRPGKQDNPTGQAAPVEKDRKPWHVRADELRLAVMSAMPAKELAVGQVAPADPSLAAVIAGGEANTGTPLVLSLPVGIGSGQTFSMEHDLGIRPMGITQLSSVLAVTIVDEGNQGLVTNLDQWQVKEDRSAMPAAVWDTKPLDIKAPPDAKKVPDCIVGVRNLKPPPGGPRAPKIGTIDSEALGWDPVPDKEVTAAVDRQPAPSLPAGAIPAVAGDATAQKRIAQALQQAGFAEAAGFAIAATPTFRELTAAPMGSTLAA